MNEGAVKRRQEKAQATKEKIFAASVALMQEKGYEAVTVSEICRTVGIAKGAFYLHYQSKEDIIRERYYRDLGDFVTKHYAAYRKDRPQSSASERIETFLALELEFAQSVGRDVTCLAYALNLSHAVKNGGDHFQKRVFTQDLRDEIAASLSQAKSTWTAETVFTYFESLVRGILATWCFGDDQALARGREYLSLSVRAVYYGVQRPGRRESLATELL